MALNANALLTLAEATAYLRPGTSAAEQAALENAVNRASTFAENYCGRPLVSRIYTNLRLRGTADPKLYLTHYPVISISGVVYNETAQTVWTAEADGSPADFDVILCADDPFLRGPNHLWRDAGWLPSSTVNPYPVKIGTLRAGFDPAASPDQHPIPDDLREAAFLLVQKFYRDQSRQLAEVAQITSPDGQLQMFDTVLPRRARDILDGYRVMVLA